MRRFLPILPLTAALLPLHGCPQPQPSDDDDAAEPRIVDLPGVVPNEWLRSLSGTVTNRKEYVSGGLEGTECTETFEVAGADVTTIVPDQCAQCDIVFGVFLTQTADCPGGDDLADDGELGFDLRQEAGETVLWWYIQGWTGSQWTELGTAALSRAVEQIDLDDPASYAGLALDVDFGFDDPDNGSWIANFVAGTDECAWLDPCYFDGYYTLDLAIAYEVDDAWLQEAADAL